MVKYLSKFGIRGAIIHLFALPAADDEAAALQKAEMMRYCGTAHIDDGSDVEYAFFAVAEKPEDAKPAGIAELL